MCNTFPTISVIVTTYNRKEFLLETVKSILNQTVSDFELIVVDNFSDYDFFQEMNILNDDRIRAFQNNNDGIIARNRNFGIKKARGEFIAFCDDDDYWAKDKLIIQLSHFNTDVDLVGIGTNCKNIGDTEYYRKTKKINFDIKLGFEDLFRFGSVALSSLLIKNYGLLFDESILFKYVEDFDFQVSLILSKGGKIKLLQDELVSYRIHISGNGIINRDHNYLNVVEKYRTQLSTNIYHNAYARYFFSLGIKSLRFNDKSANIYFYKSLKYYRYMRLKDISKAFIGLTISILPNIIIKKILFIYYNVK